RDDDRAILHRRLAPRHDLRLHDDDAVWLSFANFDQAHAATRHHGKRFVVAVVRDEHPGAVGGLNAVQVGGADLDRLVVHVNRWHVDSTRSRMPEGHLPSRRFASAALTCSTPFAPTTKPPCSSAFTS